MLKYIIESESIAQQQIANFNYPRITVSQPWHRIKEHEWQHINGYECSVLLIGGAHTIHVQEKGHKGCVFAQLRLLELLHSAAPWDGVQIT